MVLISSKTLSNTDIKDRFSIETGSLQFLPPFPPGENAQNLYVEDEEGNEWCFRLVIRRGRYSKPVLSAGWRRFVRAKGLQSGFTVEFLRERDQATGGFKFKIRIIRRPGPFRLFGVVIGYN